MSEQQQDKAPDKRLAEIRERARLNTGPNFGFTHQLTQDIDYLLSLLQQPTSERCGKCGHSGPTVGGQCASESRNAPGLRCGCKCVFPALGAPTIDPARVQHPEDICWQCYRPNISWFGPNVLWNKAVRANGLQEILCPVCFVKAVEAIDVKTTWEVAPRGWHDQETKQSIVRAMEIIKNAVDGAPATVVEGEAQSCLNCKHSEGVDAQGHCKHVYESTAPGMSGTCLCPCVFPTPVPPVAAGQDDDVESLHLAICQAVHLMNQGDFHAGHDLLRQTLVDFANKKALLSRSEIVRQQQRKGGGGEVTGVMVSPSTPTTGEGAREQLVQDIVQDVSTFFLDENAAYNLDTLPGIIRMHLSRFPPTEATQVAVEAAAREIAQRERDLFPNQLSVNGIVAIISKHCTADAGAIRASAIRLCANVARMMAIGENYETGRQKALNIAAALESLTKKEGDDGPL